MNRLLAILVLLAGCCTLPPTKSEHLQGRYSCINAPTPPRGFGTPICEHGFIAEPCGYDLLTDEEWSDKTHWITDHPAKHRQQNRLEQESE